MSTLYFETFQEMQRTHELLARKLGNNPGVKRVGWANGLESIVFHDGLVLRFKVITPNEGRRSKT